MSTEPTFVWWWNNCPLAMWRPVTAVALGVIGQVGRTYLLNVSSPNADASCVISAEVPIIYVFKNIIQCIYKNVSKDKQRDFK